MAHGVADDAPSIYTHQRWQEFVDLAAYLEDPSEYGIDLTDSERYAGVCLYMIAERLVRALVDEAEERQGEYDDTEDDDTEEAE